MIDQWRCHEKYGNALHAPYPGLLTANCIHRPDRAVWPRSPSVQSGGSAERRVTLTTIVSVAAANMTITDIHATGKNFQKGAAYDPMNAQPGVHNLGFSPSAREHARRRRIIGQGFSDTSMRETEPYILQHIQNLCDRLLQKEEDLHSTGIDLTTQVTAGTWTDPKNMANWGQ